MDAPSHDAPRALVVLDDADRTAGVAAALATEGFAVRVIDGLGAALGNMRGTPPDIVVTDDAPPAGGVDAVRAMRALGDAFIVLVVQRLDEVQTILALSSGADDVVGAGVTDREIAARCRAMLRRARMPVPRDQPLQVGRLMVDPGARTASGPRGEIPLTRIEFDVLWALVQPPRAVVERRQLREHAWGTRWSGDDHALDVHVSNLRGKLAAAGEPVAVVTVRGVGFRADVPG